MKFNSLITEALKDLDPETQEVWKDIVPHLEGPKVYNVYTVSHSRGAYSIWNTEKVKAKSLEKVQEKVYKENYSDDSGDSEFVEILPIKHDDIALVDVGNETVAVISTKKLNIKQIEEYVENYFNTFNDEDEI